MATTPVDAPAPAGDEPADAPADASANASADVESMAITPSSGPFAPRPPVGSVLWVGDSVAADEAPAIVAALYAAGVPAVDGAFAARRLVESDGVVPSELFPPLITDADADLVVVQLSLWDSPFDIEQLRSAFAWFAGLVTETGAQLLFVTPPPVREDLIDPGLGRQVQAARELVVADPGHVQILDTAELWGPVVLADLDGDGAPDRKYDLVHVCPQGAARFAEWLIERLAERYDGIVPADPNTWWQSGWSSDERYDTPAGACAAL